MNEVDYFVLWRSYRTQRSEHWNERARTQNLFLRALARLVPGSWKVIALNATASTSPKMADILAILIFVSFVIAFLLIAIEDFSGL